MSIDINTEHPLPWSAHGVFIQDGKARIIGAMHTLGQAQLVVDAVNQTAVAPALGADQPLPGHALLRERLTPVDALALATYLANEYAHIVVREPAGLVLGAMKDTPERTLQREQQREDWRGQVAGAELTRRLDEFAKTRNQG